MGAGLGVAVGTGVGVGGGLIVSLRVTLLPSLPTIRRS